MPPQPSAPRCPAPARRPRGTMPVPTAWAHAAPRRPRPGAGLCARTQHRRHGCQGPLRRGVPSSCSAAARVLPSWATFSTPSSPVAPGGAPVNGVACGRDGRGRTPSAHAGRGAALNDEALRLRLSGLSRLFVPRLFSLTPCRPVRAFCSVWAAIRHAPWDAVVANRRLSLPGCRMETILLCVDSAPVS